MTESSEEEGTEEGTPPREEETLVETVDESELEAEVSYTVSYRETACARCHELFPARKRLVDHYKSHHPKVTVLGECGKCGRRYKKFQTLACHAGKCQGKPKPQPHSRSLVRSAANPSDRRLGWANTSAINIPIIEMKNGRVKGPPM